MVIKGVGQESDIKVAVGDKIKEENIEREGKRVSKKESSVGWRGI